MQQPPTDTFPKTGRVTEACKEWIIREDNALAQHLQSQEINDHYRGNRHRNQVVREDFPTALNEQKLEEQTASKQAARYYEMMDEQEQADARVAQELADRLHIETEFERQKQIEYNERLARRLQQNEIGHPSSSMAPINELPIPPKKLQPKQYKASNGHKVEMIDTKPRLNYVSLDLGNSLANVGGQQSTIVHNKNHQPTQYSDIVLPNCSSPPPSSSHRELINLQSHTPEKQYQLDAGAAASGYSNRIHREQHELSFRGVQPKHCGQPHVDGHLESLHNQFDNIDPRLLSQITLPNDDLNLQSDFMRKSMIHFTELKSPTNVEPSASSIRQNAVDTRLISDPQHHRYSISNNSNEINAINKYADHRIEQNLNNVVNVNKGALKEEIQKLSPEKFDLLMGNRSDEPIDDELGAFGGGGGSGGINLKPEQISTSDTNVPKQPKHVQIDRIKTMQEFGVPPEEIIEIDRRLTQEQRDEELARLLQQEENKTLTFEERDRIVAMEEQDKELARMLQEREKAKAKRAKERAKERARLKKIEQGNLQPEESYQHHQQQQQSDAMNSIESSHSRTRSSDADSYSDPVDLLTPSSKLMQNPTIVQYTNHHRQQNSFGSSSEGGDGAGGIGVRDSMLNITPEENYSNPIDFIQSQSNYDNNLNLNSNHGYVNNHKRDDEIYQLPISECADVIEPGRSRPATRPTYLDIRASVNGTNMQRSHIPDLTDNIATVIDPTYELHSGAAVGGAGAIGGGGAAAVKQRQSPLTMPSQLPDFLEQNSSPVPPYMPIQGTRRNTSLENKKKKSKDKCTHQ